jgi:hypothetical protein
MSYTKILPSNLDSMGFFSLFRCFNNTPKNPKSPSVIGAWANVTILARSIGRWGIARITQTPYSRWRSRLVDRLVVLVEGDRHV